MILREESKPLTLVMTVVCSLADSYVDAGSAAELAAVHMVEK